MSKMSWPTWLLLAAGIVAAFSILGSPTGGTTGAQTSLRVATMDSSQAGAAARQAQPLQGLPADALTAEIHVTGIRLVPATQADQQEPAPFVIPVNLDLDLLTLSSTPIDLTQATVFAGDYSSFGLIVTSGEITFPDRLAETLVIPSGGQVGLRFQGTFTLPEGVATVTLDWNTNQSIHRTGQGRWIIRPTSLRFLNATGQEVEQEPEQPPV